MADFPHLNLIQVLEKRAFKPGTVRKTKSVQTRYNLEHRQEHFNNLSTAISNIRQGWQDNIQAREDAGLPILGDNGKALPVYLKIDLDAKDIESLASFGIIIISEEEEGFILGANVDDFKKFEERLDQFLHESNKKFKDSAASILEIVTDPIERLRKILSPDLFNKWNNIRQTPEITVYVAISAYIRTPDYPGKDENETDEEYEQKVHRWKQRSETWQRAKDDLARDRETAFENIVTPYNAEFLGSYIEFDDGFGCKLRITGQGFVDMCLNCPYIFSVEEHDDLDGFKGTGELEQLIEVEVLAPDVDKPKVCVIDSGIQEGHRLLSPAIDSATSVSYVPNDTDTFDKVSGGGHGTRVAGAILYPEGFTGISNPYQLPFWIQNARILNQDNKLSSLINEVDAMNDIVNRYSPTRLFNLSASRERSQNYTHMPLWAAAIDKLIWEKDILFIIAAGNIPRISNDPDIPSIRDYVSSGTQYPDFLKKEKSKITSPAHSSFALTVGSICMGEFDNGAFASFGKVQFPSSFSRTGLGLWGMIKPDVVEYGGDFIYDKSNGSNITTHDDVSPFLVRSTRNGGPAIGKDAVGTSFSTPKVAHIAAAVQALYPNEPALLYRALIVQSASLPDCTTQIDNCLYHYGYGLPDINKATINTVNRVTLYATGNITPKNTNLYRVKIPTEISRPGNEYNIKIEITLSYKAEPRITRKGTRSYLSAWLDWEVSKPGESLDMFKDRILSQSEDEDNNETSEQDALVTPDNENFKWVISSRSNSGNFAGLRRQDGTLQKDWCIVPSNRMPNEFVIAVKGHKGWQRDLSKEIPYAIVVSFEVIDNPEIDIYNLIEVENRVEIEVAE